MLRAYLEDDLLVEKGYLKEGEGKIAKWSGFRNVQMVTIIKMAVEWSSSPGTSENELTRKLSRHLENNLKK